jgi:hypothetical protein
LRRFYLLLMASRAELVIIEAVVAAGSAALTSRREIG